MKKIITLILCLQLILLITGCSTNKKEEVKEKSKGNCEIIDCINKIELSDNLEKINEIIGFSATKSKENTYKWKLNSTDSVIVTLNKEIKIKLLDETIKNNKTTFSKYSKLEEKLKNGETLTIDDLNNAFKSKGVLIEKTSTELKYRWVDNKDSYIDATINKTNGKCYMLDGMI